MLVERLLKCAHRSPPAWPEAVIVFVDLGQCGDAGVQIDELEQFVGLLRGATEDTRLGEYDGCDRRSSEVRAYLFSNDAEALAAALVSRLRRHRVFDCARIVVSVEPLKGSWREVSA